MPTSPQPGAPTADGRPSASPSASPTSARLETAATPGLETAATPLNAVAQVEAAQLAATPGLETAATAVVLPIRSFDGALSRLSEVMDGSERSELMRLMAERVVDAADGLPVHVATDDAGVEAWAADMGAATVGAGRPGLSLAVTVAVDQLATAGFERVVVAHADLALARTLLPATGPGMTIVPDAPRDGSNVLCVPTNVGFRFAYGPGSFQRHVAEAGRLGLAVTVLDDPDLAIDIDHPDDLRHLPDDYWRALRPGALAASR